MKIEKQKQQLRQQQQQQQQLNMQNNTQQLLPYSDNQVKEINHYNYNQRRGSLPQPPRVHKQPSVQTYPPSAGTGYHSRSKSKALNGFQHPAMINHKSSSNSVVKNNRQREQLYYIQNFHPEMMRNYEGMSCSSSQSGGSLMHESGRHRQQQVSSVGSYDEMESEIMSPPSPPPNSIFEPIDAKRKR